MTSQLGKQTVAMHILPNITRRKGNQTMKHCVKRVRIRSYYGLYFPAFGLNTDRYGLSLRIQSECGKIRTRITPNTDTFHTVKFSQLIEYNIRNIFLEKSYTK